MKRLFTVATVIGVGGCSLFGFDGFSGGELPAEAGAIEDASSEPPPKQNPPNEDAGGDGGPAGPFCKTTGADAALCDDFEEPGTFTTKWPEQDSYLGKLEVLDAIGLGGSRGLRFDATPRNDGQIGADARVVLAYTTSSAVQRLDCEVAVKLTTIPAGTYLAGPMHVQFAREAGGRQAIGFYLDDQRMLAVSPIVFGPNDEVLFGGGGKNVSTLPLDVWSRVRLVADVGASPPALFVYVDGSLKHEQTMDGFTPDKASVRIGANYAGGTSSKIGFDLDDARIGWK